MYSNRVRMEEIDQLAPLDPRDHSEELINEDVMYEAIDDEQYSRAEFEEDLEFLVERGWMLRFIVNGEDVYGRRPGLNCVHLAQLHLLTPRRRELLYQVTDAPKTKSFLYNTQKGKSEYSVNVLKEWTSISRSKKIIGIVILSNDQTLGDQSINGILSQIGRPFVSKEIPIGVFPLMSQYKVTEREIQTYCDAYRGDCDNEYQIPLIFSLDNRSQREKIQKILVRMETNYRPDRESLCAAFLFDECDSTYPSHREMVFPRLSHEYIIHEVQFVTATDGNMIDEYEEYRYAKCVKQPVNDNEPDYRSIHHENSVVRVIHAAENTRSQIVFNAIRDNIEYFRADVPTVGGQIVKRKVIVNGSSRGAEHTVFANQMNEFGFHALTFNMSGVKLYRSGYAPITFKTKRRRLNELLYYIYQRFGLEDRPLFIIGCRKVDRGLGFHYAPRSRQGIVPKTFVYEEHGDITFDGLNGLVFTDMILGEVSNLSRAAQKSGRLDGIIGQCPQCPITLTWWTDDRTAEKVIRHKTRVDATHQLQGAYSAEQAKHAAIRKSRQDGDYTITHGFSTREDAHAWATENINWNRVRNGEDQPIHANRIPYNVSIENGMMRDHGLKPIMPWNELDQSNLARFGEGVRCVPVVEDGIRFVVSYKVGWFQE